MAKATDNARARYQDLTKAELAEQLVSRDLPKAGDVDELVERRVEGDTKYPRGKYFEPGCRDAVLLCRMTAAIATMPTIRSRLPEPWLAPRGGLVEEPQEKIGEEDAAA